MKAERIHPEPTQEPVEEQAHPEQEPAQGAHLEREPEPVRELPHLERTPEQEPRGPQW